MSGILVDLLIGGVGCLAVVILALVGVFRRLNPRGRVILGVSLSVVNLQDCVPRAREAL